MASKTKSRKLKPLDSNVILGAISPANQYLVRLIEDKKELSFKKPTLERMNLVFQVLEDLLPHMGIFTRVLKLIRDELYDGVYSSQLTASSAAESETADAIAREPYFSLFCKLQEKRNEEAEAVCTKLNDLRETLLQKEKDQIHLQCSVFELKENNQMLQDQIIFLNKKVYEKTEESKRLHQDYQDLQGKVAKQAKCYDVIITDLRAMLQTTKDQVASLSQYKKVYEELQEGFQYPMEMKKNISLSTIFTKTSGKRKIVQTRNKTHLRSCIEAAKQLENQLLQVQTSGFEDFDLYLENHKTWLASKKFQNNRDDPAYCVEELEIQTINKEFAGKQKIFQQSMAQIVIELALVNQHKESLVQQLNEQEKSLHQGRQDEEKSVKSAPHTTQAPVSKVISGSSGLGRGSSPSVLSGLENHVDESLQEFFSDAFTANEIALNKYSAMISTSCDGGSSYIEVKEATMCLSCAEKTLICPHKIGNNCVIALPTNCTHIKISRPKAHIITMEAKLLKARDHFPASVCDTETVASPESSSFSQILVDSASTVSTDQANKSQNDTAQLPTAPRACKLQPPQAESSWQREEKNALGNDFSSIWDCFRKCTHLKQTLPRIISLHRCLSIIEHLAANLVRKDETKLMSKQALSVQDSLIALFTEYYVVEDFSNLSLFNFLTAIERHATTNRLIAVFGHILCGKLDAVVLRYIALMAELVNCVPWQSVSDFQMFVSVVYSLQGDELETMVTGYLGLNEKHVSKTLVMEYILKLILTNSEPLFEECEANLQQHSGTEPGYLASAEFAQAFEKIAPQCNAKVSQVLVEQALAAKPSAFIPLSSAAQITAYLILLQQVELHKEHLQMTPGLSWKSTNEVAQEDGHLITMSRLKLLANNIARSKKIQLAYVQAI
ncbi:uncharacterized protein LOC119979396 isoform X2 [Scyliorhinus canicula]|uniref:uncharacterized protein LOC119979396 isoform X2 n=1 Tax=Scyliorhinus canicula TaxID=7830 RepID=UPI0018F59C2C|nr:uncharacterized protein LOC119979396 isoform X2 [Scyliorhinus canicula]